MKSTLFWSIFDYCWSISYFEAARYEWRNKICFILTVSTKTNMKLLNFHEEKRIRFSQRFVPLRPDVAQ